MRDAGAFGGGRLRGAEVHAAVDGHRVATDNFAVEALGEGEREGGLTASGWTEKENGERVAQVRHPFSPGSNP